MFLTVCTFANAQEDVLYKDNGTYGNYYTGNIYGEGPRELKFEINFNTVNNFPVSPTIASKTAETIDSRRDVSLSFTGLTIGRNGFFVYVNNVLRIDAGLYVGAERIPVYAKP